MDGATSDDFNATGLNTRNGSTNSYVNNGLFAGAATGIASTGRWDDWFLFNDQGSAPNNWAGQVRCYSYFPNADTTVTWTPDSGANNFSRVNQIYDADTTYISTSTASNVDKYGLAALPTTPIQIFNIQTRLVGRMDDAGPHTVSSRLWSSTSTADSVGMTCSATYGAVWKNNLTDPATGLAWASSTLSTISIGAVDVL
jgi:hypothetical protein